MKKILMAVGIVILVAVALVVALGIYKFNFTNDDIYIAPISKTNFKDATYIINGESITLKNGVSESDAVPGSASKTITRYFGNEATGDLNGDGREDVAFILTQDGGGSGTFYYLVVALNSGNGYLGLNTVLLGDRIAPQTTEIGQAKVIVNYVDRKADEPMSTSPSVGVSKYFQVTNNQLVETSAPIQIPIVTSPVKIANPASVNCASQGGNLVIQKRGDGGEYGLCYFEDNRACEEWALLRGDCPTGGVKTTGFDTIDQNFCAWSGGETFAVPQSVCTFKNGSKCPTLDFYNGTCSPTALE